MPNILQNIIVNPTSTLIRPSNTTAYSQNDLIASSVTAASVVVPSFACGSGPVSMTRFRLWTSATTGWGSAAFNVGLWLAPATYTNGDNGAYALATGSAGFLGQFTITLTQFADGAAGVCTSFQPIQIVPSYGVGVLYWDLQYTSAPGLTPISAQSFILTPEMAA